MSQTDLNRPLRATWIQHGGEYGWFGVMSRVFAESGIQLSFVATLKTAYEEVARTGMDAEFISAEAFTSDRPVGPDEAARLDAVYGPPLLGRIADSDLHLQLLFGNHRTHKSETVARAYGFWERYVREKQPDVFIVRETATFATRTAMNVARACGIPILRPDIGPDNDHFTICDIDEQLMWSELLESLAAGSRALSAAERGQVDALVAERITSRFGRRFQAPSGHRLAALARLLVDSRLTERRIPWRTDPIAVAEQRTRRKYAVFHTMGRFQRTWFPYAKVAREKYVYMPLLFTREATNLAVLPFWSRNLIPLVKDVASAMPHGWTLYVKEHPLVPGDLPLADLLKLRAIPRVKLIAPLEPSLDVIRDAGAVITFQGSAGWEAFLQRRPVIVISGKPFYSYSALVTRVEDIGDLPEALARNLRHGASIYERREQDWAWFIHCVLNSCFTGRFIMFEPPYLEMDEANSTQVARRLAVKIRSVSARSHTSHTLSAQQL